MSPWCLLSFLWCCPDVYCLGWDRRLRVDDERVPMVVNGEGRPACIVTGASSRDSRARLGPSKESDGVCAWVAAGYSTSVWEKSDVESKPAQEALGTLFE